MSDDDLGSKVVRRKPKGARGEQWGILNPYGDLWTHTTFDTPDDARAYVRAFWRGIDGVGDLRRFRPIRVKVHVTPVAKKQADGSYALTTSPERVAGEG